MSLKKGDIVLVPFPFTNLSQTKLRPGVILWVDTQSLDITLCFISSQNLENITPDEVILSIDDSEFVQTGLKVSSKIRVAKVATVERRLLKQKLGQLGQKHIEKLNEALKFAFQLN